MFMNTTIHHIDSSLVDVRYYSKIFTSFLALYVHFYFPRKVSEHSVVLYSWKKAHVVLYAPGWSSTEVLRNKIFHNCKEPQEIAAETQLCFAAFDNSDAHFFSTLKISRVTFFLSVKLLLDKRFSDFTHESTRLATSQQMTILNGQNESWVRWCYWHQHSMQTPHVHTHKNQQLCSLYLIKVSLLFSPQLSVSFQLVITFCHNELKHASLYIAVPAAIRERTSQSTVRPACLQLEEEQPSSPQTA